MTGINLLPQELKEERKKVQINFKVFLICLSVLSIFILGLIGLEVINQIIVLNLKSSQNQIQWQEQEIAKLKDIDQGAKEISQTLSLLDNLEKNQIIWSKILKDIAASTPSALQITGLTINSKTQPNFTITGSAASLREIAKFKEKLESSSYLKDIAFVSSVQAETEKGIVFNFNLRAEFENKK